MRQRGGRVVGREKGGWRVGEGGETGLEWRELSGRESKARKGERGRERGRRRERERQRDRDTERDRERDRDRVRTRTRKLYFTRIVG